MKTNCTSGWVIYSFKNIMLLRLYETTANKCYAVVIILKDKTIHTPELDLNSALWGYYKAVEKYT